MATTTLIERLPADWLNAERFGDGWDEVGVDPAEAWEGVFCAWLRIHYPHLDLCGREIIGPATYRYPLANCQRDTPALDDLPPLPDSLYDEFCEQVGDRWLELIEDWNAGREVFGD